MNHLELSKAIEVESQKFQECYLWLESAMPRSFFDEMSQENIMLITHNLMGFDLQDYFCTINLKHAAIVMCLDSADADLRILSSYADYGIKNYLTYVSKTPLTNTNQLIRIGMIYFTEAYEPIEKTFPKESKKELYQELKKRNPELTENEFEELIGQINAPFSRSLPLDRLILALEMFFRAKTRDNCQYEVRYDEKWKEEGKPSMQIVLAWKNTPKNNFLYRLALVIHRSGLIMRRVNATYINPYSSDSILIMALSIHGANGEAAWDVANMPDFLRELATSKYFATFDIIHEKLVSKKIIPAVMGNFLRSATLFIHQELVHVDPNLYTVENIEEAFIRHPELTQSLTECFRLKFHPIEHNNDAYQALKDQFIQAINKLDTGYVDADTRRRNILMMAIMMVDYCLKTNIYTQNYSSISFRMDPAYLEELPFDRTHKFPILPYGIFFIKGLHFFGYHIRFKDLARGGLRTVLPERPEFVTHERNQIFSECYNLALTQQYKNKDIPEGGAKGIIFLKPDDQITTEINILKRELELSKIDETAIDDNLEHFRTEQKKEYLHQSQRSFIDSLLTLVNCYPDGTLKTKNIVDYYKIPEYLYLGPDENMHNEIIQWIADKSKSVGYKPGSAFISSKPKAGINHKEYGVTSLGLNVYVEELLKFTGIDPKKDPFTVKMSGGPDGDVAGNQILNFYKYYPNTAKIIAITDISGTIYDPKGLDKAILANLFKERKPVRFYPPEKLNDEGFLLDLESKKQDSALSIQTLLYKKEKGKIIEEWLNGSEMNHVYRTTIHKTKADVFIPGGGRPKTLNDHNLKDYLDDAGKPTSYLIVEGANLYITPPAREKLEALKCLIIKDSSANKTGVICSSFEVQAGLAIGDETFLKEKAILVPEILERLKGFAFLEANLLLKTHAQTGEKLTLISAKISEKINKFTDQILLFLEDKKLSDNPEDPLVKRFLHYCLKTLRTKYKDNLMSEIPESHKKAIIAVDIAAQLVYKKGLDWSPSIVDVLPIALDEIALD